MRIVWIRHTRVAVERGTCYGQTDVGLADTFPKEAAATGRNLATLGTMERVYSSPLSRAIRLAQACGYPSPITDRRLMEMDMGQWEMQRYDQISHPYLQQWYSDYMHLPTPGGEGFPQVYSRVVSFIDEVKTLPYSKIAVFAHAGVLVCAGIHARLFSIDNAWDNLTDYGGIQITDL